MTTTVHQPCPGSQTLHGGHVLQLLELRTLRQVLLLRGVRRAQRQASIAVCEGPTRSADHGLRDWLTLRQPSTLRSTFNNLDRERSALHSAFVKTDDTFLQRAEKENLKCSLYHLPPSVLTGVLATEARQLLPS
eukprot:755029-Hanusia_phi.AAC.9